MKSQDYYLGLDMGTSSVGWAVTDSNYNLLRAKGKDLWGIREFEEAETAADRRTHRISRRRRQRELARMGMLKIYFNDAINDIDPDFFTRLENSKYHLEDKDETVRYPNAVFNDENYTDKDYFTQYPTIFHLRSELINNPEPHDARLVYLAIANLFKRRGHFLNAGINSESSRKLSEVYHEFAARISEYSELNSIDTELQFPIDIPFESFEEILGARDLSRTEKSEKLIDLIFEGSTDKRTKAFIRAICGLKCDVTALFTELELEEKCSVCFSDYNYDEQAASILEAVGEDNFAIIELMKELNDIGTLSGIMKGYSYLSESRVASYEKHKSDLAALKSAIRKYASIDEYDFLFRSSKPGSYSAYVNSTNARNSHSRRNMDNRKSEDLFKSIKKILKEAPHEDDTVSYILREIETDSFLPKQLTSANGVIPNQVHKKELDAILDNASKYLPFLNETDDSGLTVSNRISQLFAFQIPYYVGPLTVKSAVDGGTGWVVRKEDGPVLPWNFDDKIDRLKTSERFIERLVRECTYLNGEKVLPKGSLLYERYCVLNEINNIRIDGEKIPVKIKQEIYSDLFEKGKKVTRKQLISYLRNRGLITDDLQLSGIDTTINSSLSSYGKFLSVFGDNMKRDSYKDMAEDIVFWCTVYGDEKRFLKDNLCQKYGNVLTESEIKKICGFKFKDWGRLSKEFLTLQGIHKQTGEIVSIVGALWSDDNNPNLMELINSPDYTFADEISSRRNDALKSLAEFTYDNLDGTYFSAPVKRMVWQTIKIIKELASVLGAPPKRVFIEMTRTDEEKGDKGRKKSRKEQLQKLYKAIKSESPEWKKEMLSKIDKADDDGKLRSKKMYLYFTQMGRCMYTGEPIELDDLFNDNLYDIDHIYPRHFVKDDNTNNNLVLVRKETNAYKSDTYPVDSSVRNNQRVKTLWRTLKESSLITEEKYKRLTGINPFTDEQLAGFIARQLVETSQGTKGIAEILKQILPEDSQIVYAKARNVSDFRKQENLLKARSINDFHHAQDAYLNIVIGNVYYVKFTKNPLNFIVREFNNDRSRNNYNLYEMYRNDIIRGDETAWIAAKNGGLGTIATVRKVLSKNTPLLTRMNFEGHGRISKETLYGSSKANPSSYLPLKTSDSRMLDVEKYGGYTSIAIAYFFLVEHGKDNKRIRSLETVPIYKKVSIESTEDGLLNYCINDLQLINPSIRLKKIRIQSLVRRNGYYMHISGKSNNQLIMRNATSICLGSEWTSYIHDIEKYTETNVIKDSISKEKNTSLFDELINKHCNSVFTNKLNPIGSLLTDGRLRFIHLDIDEQLRTLSQILQITRIGTTSGDLRTIGGSAATGVMMLGKNLGKEEELLLINQSVTGLFEKQIDLLTV